MGATHAKRRLNGMTTDLAGRECSLKGGSRQDSPRSRCPGSEVSDPPAEAVPEPRLTEEDKRLLKATWSTLEADPTTVGIITFSQ